MIVSALLGPVISLVSTVKSCLGGLGSSPGALAGVAAVGATAGTAFDRDAILGEIQAAKDEKAEAEASQEPGATDANAGLARDGPTPANAANGTNGANGGTELTPTTGNIVYAQSHWQGAPIAQGQWQPEHPFGAATAPVRPKQQSMLFQNAYNSLNPGPYAPHGM